jgi:hypothetical protein
MRKKAFFLFQEYEQQLQIVTKPVASFVQVRVSLSSQGKNFTKLLGERLLVKFKKEEGIF